MKIMCDIGNTYTKTIIFDGNKIKYEKFLTTKFTKFFEKYKNANFYVSTVVKTLQDRLAKNKKVKIISYKDIKEHMDVEYDTKNVGTDRLLSAFAVKQIFGANVVIITCGTTIVIDYLDKKCRFVGGEIFPGFITLAKMLFYTTSKLPLVKINKNLSKYLLERKNKKIIGSNTVECITKGIINFCTSGIKNFIDIIKPRYVVITGGDASLLAKIMNFTSQKVYIVENLVLLGIILWGYYQEIISDIEFKKCVKRNFFCLNIDIQKKI